MRIKTLRTGRQYRFLLGDFQTGHDSNGEYKYHYHRCKIKMSVKDAKEVQEKLSGELTKLKEQGTEEGFIELTTTGTMERILED